jgi:hypothetical protein
VEQQSLLVWRPSQQGEWTGRSTQPLADCRTKLTRCTYRLTCYRRSRPNKHTQYRKATVSNPVDTLTLPPGACLSIGATGYQYLVVSVFLRQQPRKAFILNQRERALRVASLVRLRRCVLTTGIALFVCVADLEHLSVERSALSSVVC